MRRRRDLGPVEPATKAITGADYRTLTGFGMASDAPAVSEEIRGEARRLAGLPVDRRYELLLAFLGDLGYRRGLPELGGCAERHVERARERRRRWGCREQAGELAAQATSPAGYLNARWPTHPPATATSRIP